MWEEQPQHQSSRHACHTSHDNKFQAVVVAATWFLYEWFSWEGLEGERPHPPHTLTLPPLQGKQKCNYFLSRLQLLYVNFGRRSAAMDPLQETGTEKIPLVLTAGTIYTTFWVTAQERPAKALVASRLCIFHELGVTRLASKNDVIRCVFKEEHVVEPGTGSCGFLAKLL